MENLIVDSNAKYNPLRVREATAEGNTCHVVINGDVYPRGSVEAIHTWLTQWLKENPKRLEGWLNIYNNGSICRHATRDGADCLPVQAQESRIACIPISYVIGEGLEK